MSEEMLPFQPVGRPLLGSVSRALLLSGAFLVISGPVPLALDITFGPEEGNHLGLGLLVWLCWLVGGILLAAAGLGSWIEAARSRKVTPG